MKTKTKKHLPKTKQQQKETTSCYFYEINCRFSFEGRNLVCKYFFLSACPLLFSLDTEDASLPGLQESITYFDIIQLE